MNNTIAEHRKERLYFIDLLRMIALFYMFFQHGVLEVLTVRHSSSITLVADFVPICSALFLYISGFASVLSFKKDTTENISSRLSKGFFLIIASSILFIIENGFRLPDMIFSSGILNTIGLFLISTLYLIITSKHLRISITGIIILLLTSIFVILDTLHIYIYPFTNAYECIFPTIIFGYIGIISALIYQCSDNHNIANIILLTVGIIGLSVLGYIYGLRHCFDYTNGRYTVIRTFGADKVKVWNFNSISMFASLFAVMILHGLTSFIEPLFRKLPHTVRDKIFLPGQHALINYFYHLMIWAIIVVSLGFNNLSEEWFIVILVGLFITSYPIALFGRIIKTKLNIIQNK